MPHHHHHPYHILPRPALCVWSGLHRCYQGVSFPSYLSHTETRGLLTKNSDGITGCLPQFLAPCCNWHISSLVPLQPCSLYSPNPLHSAYPHVLLKNATHTFTEALALCCFLEHTTPALPVTQGNPQKPSLTSAHMRALWYSLSLTAPCSFSVMFGSYGGRL